MILVWNIFRHWKSEQLSFGLNKTDLSFQSSTFDTKLGVKWRFGSFTFIGRLIWIWIWRSMLGGKIKWRRKYQFRMDVQWIESTSWPGNSQVLSKRFKKDSKTKQTKIELKKSILHFLPPAVNFINIKHTRFLYERHFGSFFLRMYVKKLPKQYSYEKRARLTLMKLTPG